MLLLIFHTKGRIGEYILNLLGFFTFVQNGIIIAELKFKTASFCLIDKSLTSANNNWLSAHLIITSRSSVCVFGVRKL